MTVNPLQVAQAMTAALDTVVIELRIANQWNKALHDEIKALRIEVGLLRQEFAEEDAELVQVPETPQEKSGN